MTEESQVPLLAEHDRSLGVNGQAVLSQFDIDDSSRGEEVPLHTAAGSSLFSGIANMSNSILGAGIIGLPFAISEAGFFSGIALLIVLCGVTNWTIRLIAINAKLSGTNSYIGIMERSFGIYGRVSVSAFQFAFACGGMAACGVIIGDTIPQVMRHILPDVFTSSSLGQLLVNRRIVIGLAIGCVAYPLSLYRDISKLAQASSFALVSMFVIVLSVVVRGPAVDPALRGSHDEVFTWFKPQIFEAIGVISFAYVCHHNSLLIYGSLKTPTLDRFDLVTHVSTMTSLLCCVVLSTAGYVVFTDKTQGNILNNFPDDDPVINIARLCFGLNMFTTLPLEVFVCREVMETLRNKPFNYLQHIAVTTLLVFGAMVVSMRTCDLGIVLELTGGISATALAFLFPAACYYKLLSGPWYRKEKICAAACTCFGMIVMLLSLLLGLKKLYNGNERHKQTCV